MHRITDSCLSIFNVNGNMVKVQKSKLVEKLDFVPLVWNNASYIGIIDMGFIWRLATPSAEDREKKDETCYSWGDYAKKMFDMIIGRHLNASMIVLVNDPYDLDISIKDSEHIKRATDKGYLGGSQNIFIRSMEKLPGSKDFNKFFRNPQNKIRLQKFLKDQFSYFLNQGNFPQFIYSMQKHCWDLSTGDEMHEFECSQMEADTIMFYIYAQLRKTQVEKVVVIDAEDTDVVVLAAYASHTIEGKLGIRRKGTVMDCMSLCSAEIARIIVPLHVNSGADAVSGFFGHGKKTILQKVMKSEYAQTLLKGNYFIYLNHVHVHVTILFIV